MKNNFTDQINQFYFEDREMVRSTWTICVTRSTVEFVYIYICRLYIYIILIYIYIIILIFLYIFYFYFFQIF
jgi:hypothetical protein